MTLSKLEVDSLRGVTILSVLLWHSTLWLKDGLEAMQLAPGLVFQATNGVSRLIEPLRMPLFTVLSGLVYAYRPVTLPSSWAFMQGKVRRILVPLLTLTTLHVLIGVALGHEPLSVRLFGERIDVSADNFWLMYFFGYGHLWFLQALFAIFASMIVIDSLRLMDDPRSWLVIVLLFTALPFFAPGPDLWSAWKTVELAVFFYFGVGVYRHRELLLAERTVRIAKRVFLACMLVFVARLQEWYVPSPVVDRLLLVLLGTSGCVSLIGLRLSVEPLARIGVYSYAIYLFHGIANELHPLYDGLLAHGVAGRLGWLALMMSIGVAFPVAVEKVFRNVSIVRTILLGKRMHEGGERRRSPGVA